MKKTSPHFIRNLGALAVLTITALSAQATVNMQLDRADINADETAELTVTASGNGSNSVEAPTVTGLQFTAVSQSSQMEIINGNASSTSSITYEVAAQGPGTYAIPSADPNAQNLILHVHAGSGGGNNSPAQVANNPATTSTSPVLPTPVIQGATPSAPRMVANGTAFMRMQMPKHDLYVGETVPVDIQIGLRSGMAATISGLPTLSADAFTLNKLTDKPEQTEEEINGQPYSILTWHSVLAAIKPGDFSLAVHTPVTVQVRTAAPRMSGDDSDIFNDPFFQNFFGGVTQKDLNLANDPVAIKVLPLPTAGQPADFSGAVGNFTISSEVSPTSGTVGDPLTLRLKITGTGAFDRVQSSMLSSTDGWKTYRATGKFIPADSVGYRGEKDFEQAVIPQHPGQQTVPPVAFTFFNPETHQYEILHTTATIVDIAPGTMAATTPTPSPTQPAATPVPPTPTTGLRPDMTESGIAVQTLRPLYYQPGFLFAQSTLALAFIAAGFWLRRNDQLAADPIRRKRIEEFKAVHEFLAQMDSAAHQHDVPNFFSSARQALQYALASRWKMTPAAITLAEVDTRLNGKGENIRRVFELADELAYSGGADIDADFPAWKQTVHQLVKETETL